MLFVEGYAIEVVGVDARVCFGNERAANGELSSETDNRDGDFGGCAVVYGGVDVVGVRR